MDGTVRTVVFWVVVVISALFLWQVVRAPQNGRSPEITYSAFITKAQAGEIASVNISDSEVQGVYRNGAGRFHLTGPSNPAAFLGILQDKGVEIRFQEANGSNRQLQLLGAWAPLILLAALWFFMIRQKQIRQRRRPSGPGAGVDFPDGLH
jgi:cell division protease FtsH